MPNPVLEREISERLKVFLESNQAFSEYSIFVERGSIRNLEGMLDLMINTVFSKNNWKDVDEWVIVFYILTGRIALQNELVALRWAFQSDGVLGVKLEIEKFFENLNSETRLTFITVEPDSIFIDVSHTLNYPFNILFINTKQFQFLSLLVFDFQFLLNKI